MAPCRSPASSASLSDLTSTTFLSLRASGFVLGEGGDSFETVLVLPTQEGTWLWGGGAGPAEPPNSIPGGCSGAEGAQGLRIRLWEALGSPCQGSLGCSSPPCVDGLSPAHPGGCGEAGSETPTPCPRVPPDGVMGWEAGAGGSRRNGMQEKRAAPGGSPGVAAVLTCPACRLGHRRFCLSCAGNR